jgi:hypothetical protein
MAALDRNAATTAIAEATALLLTSSDWRQRVVEKMRPLSADHYELRRSFQFEIPPGLVGDLARQGSIDTLLPVTWLPKHALLDFDVLDASGAPLMVLERRSIAAVLAGILAAWRADLEELEAIAIPAELLESVCWASMSPWNLAIQRGRMAGTSTADIACRHIEELLQIRVSPLDMKGVVERDRDTARRAYTAVGRTPGPDEIDNTLTGTVILAPYLVPRPAERGELLETIDHHTATVSALVSRASDSADVRKWLDVVIRAGSQWPLLARSRVPVDEPFLIKTREVRESGKPSDPREFVHRSDLSAARSYHLHVSAPESNVWMAEEPVVRDPERRTVGPLDVFENSELTDELFTMYTSIPDRPSWVDVTVRFRLRWTTTIAYIYAMLIAAVGLTVALGDGVSESRAAVLTIPTTLVSGFLLARDAPLAARFLRRWRGLLALLSAALWAIVLWKVLGCPWEAAGLLAC